MQKYLLNVCCFSLTGWFCVSVTLTHHLLGQLNDQLWSDGQLTGLAKDGHTPNILTSDQSKACYGSQGGSHTQTTDLEILENDIKTLLKLLLDEKFAHPYGTVAGSVA